MIRNVKAREKFDRDLARRMPSDHARNLRIMEWMFEHARSLGAVPRKDMLEGLDFKIEFARRLGVRKTAGPQGGELQMDDLAFLDKYSGQSTVELIQLESTYRIDSLILAFEEALDQKETESGPASLTKEERVIQAVEALEREVNNGGYSQFFYNSSCKYVPLVVESLYLIGCSETARLTEKAIEIIGISENSSWEQFQEKIADDDSLDERFEPIDEKFYEYEEDIATKLFAFIKVNRKNIVIGNK